MLHLTTGRAERLEIPAYAILAVIKPCDDTMPCAIVFDMGFGMQFEQLSDQYGFVKKAVIDSMAMVNPIEARILEPVQVGEGDATVTGMQEGKVFLARERIIGRREIGGDPNGIKAKLFVDLVGKRMLFNIADTLDELDGTEAPKKPKAASAAPRPANLIPTKKEK
jgi:hypothetical protein